MCSALPFLDAALGTSRVPLNGFSELYGSSGPQRFCIARRSVVEAALISHAFDFDFEKIAYHCLVSFFP
jgi:hypothetical protein